MQEKNIWSYKTILLAVFIFLIGCRGINPTFVQAMREHRDDTKLVNDSLIAAFEVELAKESRPEAQAAYQEIINNLRTVSHQADILDKYVWHTLTEEQLAALLHDKWRTKP